MIIAAASDIHTLYDDVKFPEADLLILAGDMLNRGHFTELLPFMKWLRTLDYERILYVPGNHDCIFQSQESHCRTFLPKNVTLLIDEEITIDGIKFYGSPWVAPINGMWAFEFSDYTGWHQDQVWSNIPDDTDVLITHSPPQGILSGPWGCEWLRDKVLKLKPKVHCFGHVHSESGFKHFNGTRFYNLAICDERYRPVNPVTVFEV